jgi:hypothetical protein
LAAALLLARDRCVCLQLPLECEPAKPRYPRRTHKELSFNILCAHTGDFSSDLFCGGFLRVVLGGISFEGGIGYRTTTPGASFCFLGRYLLVFSGRVCMSLFQIRDIVVAFSIEESEWFMLHYCWRREALM